jgi:SAM-dependent methyltransferase
MKLDPVVDYEYLQPNNKDLFELFKYNNDIDWTTDKILDFGCNVGNYVSNAGSNISPDNYLGIDLNLKSIEEARHRYPKFNFIHYDKWHPSWNPNGALGLNVQNFVKEKFDVIIAYSVFTHTSILQTKQEIDNLLVLLKPGGKILFTIWTSDIFYDFYKWVYERYDIPETDILSLEYDRVAYWLDNKMIKVDENEITGNYKSVCTFYKVTEFQKLFPMAEILGIPTGQHQLLVQITNPGVTRGLD